MSLRGVRVVVCDDHRLLLQALATALADLGCVIEAAAKTPLDAIRAVEQHHPDILLSDVSFPRGSGLDAARHVVAHHPRTTVVMLTGSDAPEPLAEALEIGVAGYTRKDQRIEGIAAVMERALRGEPAVDEAMLRRLSRRPPRPRRSPLDALTPRERHVLGLLVDGLGTTEIVRTLGISHSTARTHVQSILSKLGVHSRLQAVALLGDLAPTVLTNDDDRIGPDVRAG